MEYLKKELNSKDELIKSLIDTHSNTRQWENLKETAKNSEKGHLQVEPSPILTSVQLENQSYHKNNICWKPRLKRDH